MSVNSEETNACGVNPCHDKIRADVSLVAEEVLFQHCHAGDDAGRPAGREGVQFEVGGDQCGGKLGISGGTSAGAPDRRGDVMEFFTVLIDLRLVLV